MRNFQGFFFTAIGLFTIMDQHTLVLKKLMLKKRHILFSIEQMPLLKTPGISEQHFPCEHDTFLFMLRITTGLALHHETTSSV